VHPVAGDAGVSDAPVTQRDALIDGTGGTTSAGGTTSVGGAATGGTSTGGGTGMGGTGKGGVVADAAIAPMIISIDFVGGTPPGDSGTTGTVVMAATESAGVKPATHWNSAATNTGTLASLKLAGGTTTSASATWSSLSRAGKRQPLGASTGLTPRATCA
jgi:hypothetical protein